LVVTVGDALQMAKYFARYDAENSGGLVTGGVDRAYFMWSKPQGKNDDQIDVIELAWDQWGTTPGQVAREYVEQRFVVVRRGTEILVTEDETIGDPIDSKWGIPF